MEEKERYESKYNEKLMKHYAFDNENKEELGYKGVVRVLNQQDARIKELNTKLVEEMELSAERRQIIEDLTIENNQQDKEIEELKEKYNKLYECYKKTASEDLQDKYRLAEENQQLKQQLVITEKALELAMEDKPRPIKYYGNYMGGIKDYIEFYKTKAKEMLKNE